MQKKVFITGGAGFIGSNAAYFFLKKGFSVTIFDNFSRKGSKKNATWLKELFPKNLNIVDGDVVKDVTLLMREIKNTYLVLHLAGQTAVTTSVLDPLNDFENNAVGTMHVLEAVRQSKENPILIYSSTNKVYGELAGIPTVKTKTRYTFKNLPNGISEDRCVDFHSPYGCSKGAADQYVKDYSRIYGLNTIVFRQSCIYGPRQFGMEDQGWVAWFLIALTKNRNFHIYGDGKQVRDILFISDLINAYYLAAKHIKVTKGKVYNIGGGPQNTLSIWYEFRPFLEKLFKKELRTDFMPARPGDQPIYISDIRKAKKDFGWEPKIGVEEGITKLYKWIRLHKELFA